MKKCSDCKNLLDSFKFNINVTKKDKLQVFCKECQSKRQKTWYVKNKERRIQQVEKRRKRIKKNLYKMVNNLKNKPCLDCQGTFNPWQMDFDHLYDKKKNIAKMVNSAYAVAVVLTEISKCELVCSNCHRNRTHKRNMTRNLKEGPIV